MAEVPKGNIMSVFSTKVNGRKISVVAENVEFVVDVEGKGEINFVSGTSLLTEVGYDSVRRNVAKALANTAEADAE